MARACHRWTVAQVVLVELLCKTISDAEIAKKLNKIYDTELSESQIKALRSRKKFLTGRDGRFKKGNIPSPNARPKGPNSTSFRRGQRPVNARPVGAESVCKKDDLVYVKIAEPNKWQSKHSVLWEQHHKKQVPEGHFVMFLDGDRRNFSIDNLVLVHRAEGLALNRSGYSRQELEVRPTLIQLAKLERKIAQVKSNL